MSEVEHKPVDVPAAEPAPAEETTAIDTKAATDALKKADKKGLLTKLKAILKKFTSKKEKAPATTDEAAPEEAAPVEPVAAPTTTAVA